MNNERDQEEKVKKVAETEIILNDGEDLTCHLENCISRLHGLLNRIRTKPDSSNTETTATEQPYDLIGRLRYQVSTNKKGVEALQTLLDEIEEYI